MGKVCWSYCFTFLTNISSHNLEMQTESTFNEKVGEQDRLLTDDFLKDLQVTEVEWSVKGTTSRTSTFLSSIPPSANGSSHAVPCRYTKTRHCIISNQKHNSEFSKNVHADMKLEYKKILYCCNCKKPFHVCCFFYLTEMELKSQYVEYQHYTYFVCCRRCHSTMLNIVNNKMKP